MEETPFDIHAIARGEDPFQTCRIVLEDCKKWSPATLEKIEHSVRLAFKEQFNEEPVASIVWATEA